jgi:hypothetical protein
LEFVYKKQRNGFYESQNQKKSFYSLRGFQRFVRFFIPKKKSRNQAEKKINPKKLVGDYISDYRNNQINQMPSVFVEMKRYSAYFVGIPLQNCYKIKTQNVCR